VVTSERERVLTPEREHCPRLRAAAVDRVHQTDMGPEALWVLRDVRSGEVLLARSLLSVTEGDLAPLLESAPRAISTAVRRGAQVRHRPWSCAALSAS
jgi:hypothetical protein